MPTQDQLISIVFAFINASTQSESQHLLDTHPDLLLSDAAEQLLANWLEQSKDNIYATRVLQERQALLARYRETSKRVAQEPKPSELRCVQPSSELIEAVLAFVNADSGTERKGLVLARGDLLLSDAADELLADWVSQSKGNDQYTRILQERRTLLAHYRHEATSHKPPSPPREKVRQAVRKFVDATSAAKRKQIVLAQQEVLLTDAAAHFLADWIEAEEESNILHHLQTCQALLTRCREEGIETAFAALSQQSKRPPGQAAKVSSLRAEISKLTRPQEMRRRIVLCKKALSLVSREDQAELWADLQNELGDAYREHIHGERADNLEQAIHHYQQALQVWTRQAFPEKWADIQNKLGIVYSNRIRGVRSENIEQAIDYYEQALQVRTRQAASVDWAATQNNLAETYRERIRGVRADNLEQAISLYKQVLQVYTRHRFPKLWAMTQQNLALAYSERIRGERAKNLELAIDRFKQALKVRTRQALPEKWATTQQNLAFAYWERIHGKRADNLELAIHHSEQALQVITRQAFPHQWAGIQNNLATTYRDRIRGERADNLEKSIHCAQQALQVYTYDAFPFQWAMTQYNLVGSYVYRIRGERAKNYEQAIHHAQKALRVITHETFPSEWAMIQDNLANVYAERIRGERALNLEQAIDHSEQALDVYTRQDFPEQWARTHNNLAANYAERVRGERALNIEQAIHHFEQTLSVCTRQAYPQQWAMTMMNLADLYAKRIHGEEAENLEKAIDYLKLGLQVITRQDFPYEWARAQNSLAMAYLNPIHGEPADNMEPSVFHAKQALDVYTRQAFPIEWAMIQSNLAVAYWLRIHGQRADNIKEAAHHAQEALQIYTPLRLPQRCRDTALVLGLLLYEQKRFSDAREALVTAHQAVEALRGEVTREMGKRILSGDNAILYGLLVDCCLREEDENAAFEYAVAGKGRAFVDMLASTRFDISKSGANDPQLAADWQKIRELRSSIDQVLTLLTSPHFLLQNAEERAQGDALLGYLQEQEAQRWEELTYKYPTLTVTQSAPQLSVPQAQALATELDATLIEFVPHAGGLSAFVVTKETVRHVLLIENKNNEIENFLKNMVIDWHDQLEKQKFNETLDLTLDEWYDVLIAPLSLPATGKMVLAPSTFLHLIPLSIARNPESLAYLCDDYKITFTPSLAALRVSHLEAKKAHQSTSGSLQSLLSAAYAGMPEWKTHPDKKVRDQYLDHAIPEVEAIAAHFPSVTSLRDNQATPQAVIDCAKGQDVIHFSCHGHFNPERPEQSGLVLSGGWLTIQRIITELRLTQTRLVTLSACQTHRIGPNISEEHTGLVQALMTAGARCVVASLWKVPEEPTRVLFEQFYRSVAAGEPPATALQKAMQVVRQEKDSEGNEIWKHPYYWAAFQVSGLGF